MTLPPLPPFDRAAYARQQLRAIQDAVPEPHRKPCFEPLLDAADDPPQWLAKDFLLANEYQLIAGDGGSFKTTVWLQTLAAVAGGYDVLSGFPTGEPRSVLLVSGEDSAGVLKNRLDAIIEGHGWDPDRIRPTLHQLCLKDVLITDLGWQLWIEECAAYHNATLLGLDPLADLIEADENDNSTARPVIRWFRRLGAQGVATLLCHHYGKPSETRQGLGRVRGASAWLHAARAVYTIEEKDGGRWLGCGKMSRAERPAARELRIEIAHAEGNRAVWTRATVALAHPPAESWMVQDARELTPAERTALAALERHTGEILSWSRWRDVSGQQASTLSMVIGRLKLQQYITAHQVGKRFGKPVWGYEITPLGAVALLPTPRRHYDSNSDSNGVAPHDSTTPMAPLGGHGVVSVELPMASEIAALYDSNGHETGPGLDPDWEPGDEPCDEMSLS